MLALLCPRHGKREGVTRAGRELLGEMLDTGDAIVRRPQRATDQWVLGERLVSIYAIIDLVDAGLIAFVDTDMLRLTEAGRKAAAVRCSTRTISGTGTAR